MVPTFAPTSVEQLNIPSTTIQSQINGNNKDKTEQILFIKMNTPNIVILILLCVLVLLLLFIICVYLVRKYKKTYNTKIMDVQLRSKNKEIPSIAVASVAALEVLNESDDNDNAASGFLMDANTEEGVNRNETNQRKEKKEEKKVETDRNRNESEFENVDSFLGTINSDAHSYNNYNIRVLQSESESQPLNADAMSMELETICDLVVAVDLKT